MPGNAQEVESPLKAGTGGENKGSPWNEFKGTVRHPDAHSAEEGQFTLWGLEQRQVLGHQAQLRPRPRAK